MSLESPNFKAAGDIYPCRFVGVSDDSGKDFYVEEAATVALNYSIIGISDESSRDGREDTLDTRAAKAGDVIKVYGLGSSPVLLEMAATCNRGDFLIPNTTTDGKGTPVVKTTGAGYQIYGAKALEACTASGQKIHVQVMIGVYHA